MSDWPALLCSVVFAGVGIFMVWLMNHQDQPHPRFMPTQSDTRTYLLDCEQFNPGRQCIVVAMPVPVPEFSDRGSE